MASSLGRNDRRRRVLNEEVLSASSTHVALRAAGSDTSGPARKPRYSDAASIENHPQVTDFVPRSYLTFVVAVVIAAVSVAGLELLHSYVLPRATMLPTWATGAIDLRAPGSLATWLSAVLLLLSSGFALLVYSLRRHRIDDYRGRYRVWLLAALAALVLSIDSVACVHRLVATSAAYLSGWTALRGDAVWWLALGSLPAAWIAARVLLDLKECVWAAGMFVLSLVGYAVSMMSFLGWLPQVTPGIEPMVTVGAALAGHWLLLVAVTTYARYVVLDAQGLITHKAPRMKSSLVLKREQPSRSSSGGETRTATSQPAAVERTSGSRQSDVEEEAAYGGLKAFRREQKKARGQAAPDDSRWTDGSDGSDGDDDDPQPRNRKLSKSERKRLRKLKARDRAA